MAEVTLDSLYDNDDFRGKIAESFSKEIHFSTREDRGTIEKVMGVSVPELAETARSLEGRVSSLPNEIAERIEQLEPEEFEALEELFVENPDREVNYVIRLQNLVAAILAQLQQISEKDKDKINQLEKEYKKDTVNAANLQRDLGWSGLKFAALCFAASFLQFLSPYESDRTIANIFAKDVCPKFGEMWSSDKQARLTSANNSCTLKMNKYNFLAQGEQSKANDKQQVTGVFDKALRGMESASRAGG